MKKIVFCGGGSAGHVIPNIAIIEDLKSEYSVAYMGTGAIERDICKTFGIEFYQFEAPKLIRGKILANLSIPFKLIKSVKRATEILEHLNPDLLFCKGGYVSIPCAKAAKKLKIPTLTHESDLEAGLANRLIAKNCRAVLTSFPSTAEKFKNGVYVGSPIRKKIFGADKIASREKFRLDMRPTLLVFGGGSGSRIINENLRKIVPKLCKKYNVLHICGKGNAVQSNVYGYRQVEFADDMGAVYACADAAVARCGSNSAFELIALGIPTLFIPLANGASRGDQVKNAKYFFAAGLCDVLNEKELAPDLLTDKIESLFSDKKIKAALLKNNEQCGNDKILQIIKANLR